jgi:hypothetical protein
MMLGGVGSIRLAPVNNKYYLNATSTGTSHQGIPIIISSEQYNSMIDEIKLTGSCKVDIEGTVEILPIDKALINYAREIPKYTIVANSITKKEKSQTKILVSVSAIYSSGNDNNYHSGRFWSFASFNPDPNEIELRKAVEWIENYAIRYSDGIPKILSDFDEHKSHFNADIEFKLEQIINGGVNEELLLKYSEKFHITINQMVMGHNIENNSGNIIIGNSGNVFNTTSGSITISNSFNKVKDKFGADAAQLLIKVAEIVNNSGNPQANEQFSAFKEELEKEQPKKSVLKTLWEGITTTLPLIKTTADIYDKVKDIIT